MKSLQITAFVFVLAMGMVFPRFASAQCPSVTGSGDPAVILLNLYGIGHGNYFAGENQEVKPGVTAGVQIGAIFSPQFQLVSGVEMDWIKRTVDRTDTGGEILNYQTFLLEIPLDMRMRIGHTKKSETHFILGAGLQLANVRSTNDPETTDDEMLFHQLLGRVGFESTITVKDAFNILWGLIGKVDPIGLANQEYSNLNGTYYAGLKLGFQFGL